MSSRIKGLGAFQETSYRAHKGQVIVSKSTFGVLEALGTFEVTKSLRLRSGRDQPGGRGACRLGVGDYNIYPLKSLNPTKRPVSLSFRVEGFFWAYGVAGLNLPDQRYLLGDFRAVACRPNHKKEAPRAPAGRSDPQKGALVW
jgi:hypothetical protein